VKAIKEYIESWNKESKPFTWTKSAGEIMGGIKKAKAVYSNGFGQNTSNRLRLWIFASSVPPVPQKFRLSGLPLRSVGWPQRMMEQRYAPSPDARGIIKYRICLSVPRRGDATDPAM
jgi:hypothetical protein